MNDRRVMVGSLLTALAASACCIGPLVLGSLGLGSLGFAAALAPLRPWFLGATAMFLALGFYFAYRPENLAPCEPGQACARPLHRRNQRIALWVVAMIAVALATYPSWGARFAASRASALATPAASSRVVLDVQGMTCGACAAEIERELRQVPGVVHATVSFEQKRAEIRHSTPPPKIGTLVKAVEKAGYRATPASQ